jgi:predicted flap endonuclease-1-like 5' DNA nuclease
MYRPIRNFTLLSIGLTISAVVGWLLLRENKRTKETTNLTVKSRTRPSEPDEMPKIVLPLETLESERPPDSDGKGTTASAETTRAEVKARASTSGVLETAADDLTQINGIGPRFAQALQAIGITRFAQLAEQTPDALAERLAGHVTVNPQRIRASDWIGQAAEFAKR